VQAATLVTDAIQSAGRCNLEFSLQASNISSASFVWHAAWLLELDCRGSTKRKEKKRLSLLASS